MTASSALLLITARSAAAPAGFVWDLQATGEGSLDDETWHRVVSSGRPTIVRGSPGLNHGPVEPRWSAAPAAVERPGGRRAWGRNPDQDLPAAFETNRAEHKEWGRWLYLYRAVDQFGQVIDVLVTRKRDASGPVAVHRGPGACQHQLPAVLRFPRPHQPLVMTVSESTCCRKLFL